ncbi:MAG: TFIIB-type zinc finger domain-containing protein [Paludibacteraceae bacterium]|nr:TFIIB-type zinc finger domain-containing protein [Paludibacteraceae bacterium]
MKRLVCEMCGGSDLVKQDGVFVCQNCGTKYSVEEAKKMMVEGAVTVEGTVAVEGTVKVDKSEELQNLYVLARRAKEADNSENACKYYSEIILKDPDNWEANFYLVYYKAASCKKGQIGNEAYNVSNCLKSTIRLLVENLGTGDQAKGFIDGIRKDLADIAGPMIHGAMDVHEYGYIGQILRMQEMLGNCLKEYPELHTQAVEAWKQLIDTYVEYACFGDPKLDYVDMYGYTPESAVQAIYELDPSYEDPFGVAKKLRRNETFITCPKCGATMRECESKCPQCGTPKEEIQRLIQERQEKDAAERERLRKEREAKEAEEARKRAEERAEWWRKNGKKVKISIICIAVIIASAIGAYLIPSTIHAKRAVAQVTQAEAYIASGDSCVAVYNFDEAENYYKRAYSCVQDIDGMDHVKNNIKRLQKLLQQAKEQAGKDYDEALRRLKIFLDADDYKFNQYSNECLDKMIQIDPTRKETVYYQNLRNK